uniref:Uncharacterized protein n=1 Tax=Chaetoceros debilis TaxID=122233 RepID=A0A7S3Q7V7_9STRA|mmetsp:Transcript_27655/g.42353  ORF Transcript_27655/g.42353 Transcript_27655/m.42353 type:complete len:437 (-) Transcript_27655:35-1345(-)
MLGRVCSKVSRRRPLPLQALTYSYKYALGETYLYPTSSRKLSDSSSSQRKNDFVQVQVQNDEIISPNPTNNSNVSQDFAENATKKIGETKQSSKFRKNAKSRRKPVHKKGKSKGNPSLGTTTDWILVDFIPPLSTLDDLLVDVERIMQTELGVGILDLDVADSMLKKNLNDASDEDGDDEIVPQPQVPSLWEPDESLPRHLVIEAHIKLSTLGRPTGWYLRFPNRSCVQALINHINDAERSIKDGEKEVEMLRKKQNAELKRKPRPKENEDEDEDAEEVDNIPDFSEKNLNTKPLRCAWKELRVSAFFPNKCPSDSPFLNKLKLGIDENVVRVENCHKNTTPYEVELFFSQCDLLDERSSDFDAVEQCVFAKKAKREKYYNKNTKRDIAFTPSATNSFLVRFQSAAAARAAVREKQCTEFMGRNVLLAQYSRQILR